MLSNQKKVKTDFKIYNKILDFNNYTRTNILFSIPKVHSDIRIHLSDECFNLAKQLFFAVYNKGNIRMKYLVEMEVTISTIDMLLTNVKEMKCIKYETYISAVKKLEEVKNMIYAWVINEEKKN